MKQKDEQTYLAYGKIEKSLKENFFDCLKQSFLKYLETGPRSNEKLRILHGFINECIKNALNDSTYEVISLSEDASCSEQTIEGLYMDKKVDIVIKSKNKIIGGIAIKFVMSNYKQNANNYFENMLGETVNIRSNELRTPYFQIFIISHIVPYFKNTKEILRWDEFGDEYLKKYAQLSNQNPDDELSVPNLTLLCVLDTNEETELFKHNQIKSRSDYKAFFEGNEFKINYYEILPNGIKFGRNVVYNDFDKFIKDVSEILKANDTN